MFVPTLLYACLVSAVASLYVDRQAPVTLRPERAEINTVQRIGSLEPEFQQYSLQPKFSADEFPPITPKQSTISTCGNSKYTFTASGQTVTLNSQRYPRDYPTNTTCTYDIQSPAGTQMTLKCDTFNVACPNDRFYYSLDAGRTNSAYCGQGVLPTVTTQANTLSIGFNSARTRPSSSSVYRYQCTIKSIGTASGGGGTPTTTTASPITAKPPGNSSCSCGVRNVNGATRIVGGVQTKSGELPWRVTVFVYDPNTGRGGICGGTIISANWVMTAAHCTMDFKQGYKINVYVGAQANPVTKGGATATIVADRYVQHPSFNRQTLNNDMTLLHLSKPLAFKSNISPACLPYPLVASDFSGTKVLASGWGTTKPVAAGADNNDAVSDTLMEVVLPVLSTAECRKYQSVTDNMICTYEPGKDTCQGDSGGSIDYQYTDTRYYSIGVVSYGIGCAQEKYPGVYTKVTNYLSWIQSTTQDTFCRP